MISVLHFLPWCLPQSIIIFIAYEIVRITLRLQRPKDAHHSRRRTWFQTAQGRSPCHSSSGPQQGREEEKLACPSASQEISQLQLRHHLRGAFQAYSGRVAWSWLVRAVDRGEVEVGVVESKAGWKPRWAVGGGWGRGWLRGGHSTQQGEDQAAKVAELGQGAAHL